MKKLFIFILAMDETLILVETSPEWVKRSTHAIKQSDGSYKYEEVTIAIFATHYMSENDMGTEGSTFWYPEQEIDRWEETEFKVVENGEEWLLTPEECIAAMEHIYMCPSCKFYHVKPDHLDVFKAIVQR